MKEEEIKKHLEDLQAAMDRAEKIKADIRKVLDGESVEGAPKSFEEADRMHREFVKSRQG